MKVLIGACDRSLDAPLDSSFESAKAFIIYETESNSVVSTLDNPLSVEQDEAAEEGARLVDQLEAKAIITTAISREAWEALRQHGVQIYSADGGNVARALENFRQGTLPELKHPGGGLMEDPDGDVRPPAWEPPLDSNTTSGMLGGGKGHGYGEGPVIDAKGVQHGADDVRPEGLPQIQKRLS